MFTRACLLLFLMLPVCVKAQTIDYTVHGYNVEYAKAHLFLTKDSDFNVVDYELEWPDIVSFSDVKPLKQYLSKALLEITVSSLDSLLLSINDRFGQSVKGPFKTIPDDNRFCYINLSAKLLAYQPNRFIAYQIVSDIAPQKLSSVKFRKQQWCVVYDLSRQKILQTTDILKKGVTQWAYPDDFYNQLFAPLDEDFYNNLQNFVINGAWVEGNDICLYVQALAGGEEATYTVMLPYDQYNYILSRNMRRLVDKEAEAQQPQMLTLPITYQGDTIYNKVEVMPVFKGGQDGLRQYLASGSRPDLPLSKAQRVVVSFVVDKTGRVREPGVVLPSIPQLDRFAVSKIMGMPPFSPGKQNGQPKCVRMTLTLQYNPVDSL